jgi:hypothetical protein
MVYIIALIVIMVITTVIVYNVKKDAALRRAAELEEQLAINNQKVAEERKARRERIEARYPTGQTTYTPPTRTFVKREESTPMYVPSPTQSVTFHNDSVTDTLVNAMILDAVMHHHNEPVISTPKYDARVESDTPTPSMSYSKSDDTPSYSSSSRDSSYSSSSSDSSYSSSSSDSSYSSSSSSDW